METGKTRYSLRFEDPKLRAELVKEAKASRRSLNAQILYYLSTHPERSKKKQVK